MTCPPHIRFIRGMITSHTRKLPQQMMKAYLRPTIYPSPRTAAPVFILSTTFALSARAAPHGRIFVVSVSPHRPKVDTMKSYSPPISPLTSSVLAPFPPLSPLTSTCVVAVASGKGYLPCISLTKYFLNGIRNRIPSMPPSSEEKNTLVKLTVSSGYLSCNIYRAGKVNMAPATIAPEHEPMDCIITFSPSEFLRPSALESPTAIIAIGIAASNTCPTFSPRKAAAAENSTVIRSPRHTDHGVTSGQFFPGERSGLYSSPGFSSLCAFSGSDVFFSVIL